MEWKTIDYKGKKAGKKGEVLDKHVYGCAFCGGKGFMPSRKNIKCSVCLGSGSVKINPPAVVCAYCNASGKSHLNADLTCNVCGGKGVISVHTKQVTICQTCKGRGRERGSSLPCLKCRGKGVFPLK